MDEGEVMIKFRVYGMPAPQGSKFAVQPRRNGVAVGRPVVVDDNKDSLRSWRGNVAEEARAAMAAQTDWAIRAAMEKAGAFSVKIVFVLPRPLSHYRATVARNQLKPSAPRVPAGRRLDLDKLARSTLDALTQAGVWADDGQVHQLTLAKVYATSPAERPGAIIEITWGES